MGFRRENEPTLLFLVILLAVSAMGLGRALGSSKLHLSIILAAFVVILMILLFGRLTRTKREILFFFKALKNDDTGIHYHAHGKGPLIDELIQQMNELNQTSGKSKQPMS